MNELEMLIAIKQMLEEIGASRMQDVVVTVNPDSLDISWTVEGKQKTYNLRIT